MAFKNGIYAEYKIISVFSSATFFKCFFILKERCPFYKTLFAVLDSLIPPTAFADFGLQHCPRSFLNSK